MDSKIDIVDHLLEVGRGFNTNSFCYPHSEFPGLGGTDKPEWLEWKTRVKNMVTSTMAADSSAVHLTSMAMNIRTAGEYLDNFKKAQNTFLKALENMRDALESDVYGELNGEVSENVSPVISNKVFIVHGHDAELKNDVERFVHEIGLEPVVLHRQVDGGDTVIEKFEKNSDVGYVFILLTPDEIAYTANQIEIPDEARKKEYRARPNVIFEFGYFVGKLGRSRVCCLHKGNTAIPSDLAGLIYKKVENSIESQAYTIIKELKAAGYAIKV